ncbi:Pkr1-domain-containing protein [Coleophoma cylindrospora]|uniref:Pkr1-domain-containing protein n=1 Tax=Coleophoma cylindrospora TaxID=1849047 RepID=A0A3D8R1N0_9HELO|nr:Pkr1-domain-containing protein [Coleophoma cylindrospora]
MAAFITNLWESVFTPGPTPTLVVATNVSFACLQLVLLSLLIATYSIHFVVLSFLSASLWAAINWFVKELAIAQARADEEAKKRGEATNSGDDSETEAETVIQSVSGSGSKEVEVVRKAGELKVRREVSGSKSEISTEDEWERVSENEKDK